MRYPWFILALLALVACSSDIETVRNEDPASGIKEEFQRSKKTGQREGFYRKSTTSGVLLEEAFYTKDQLNGVRKLYNEEGRLIIEESHKDGVFEGPYKSYYPDGTLEIEGFYKANETSGTWKRYYPSGALMEEVAFEGNMENGPFKEFYENGKPKATGAYLEGDNEHGELLEYDTTGTLIARKQCDRGICKTLWTLEKGDVQ